MVRTVLVMMALLAAPAWAVGERISVPKGAPYAEQLRETLCISMECGAATDASVTAKVIKGNKVELKVFSAAGVLKTTVTAPLTDDNRISSMDLVAATSGLIAGIEGQVVAKAEAAPAAVERPAKGKKALAAAKAKAAKKKSTFKVAAKVRGNGSRG